MKNSFQPGDKKMHNYTVRAEDLAKFNSNLVHPVCSTFALGREMEWSSRLFVLEMIDPEEEGIGTSLSITHHTPALEGEEIIFEATLEAVTNNEILCKIEAKVGRRRIASGKTGQKILKRTKIASLLKELDNG